MYIPSHPPKTLNPSIYPAPHVDSIQSNWSSLLVPGSAPLYTKNSSHKRKTIAGSLQCAPLWSGSAKTKKKKKFFNLVLEKPIERFSAFFVLLSPLSAVLVRGLGSSPTVPAPGKLILLHVCIHPYPNPNPDPAPDPELIQWSGSKDRETVCPSSNPNLWIPAKSKRGIKLESQLCQKLLRDYHRSGVFFLFFFSFKT